MGLKFYSNLRLNSGSGGLNGALKLKNAVISGNINIGVNGFSNYGYYGTLAFFNLGVETNNPYAVQVKMTTSGNSYNSKQKQWFNISNSNHPGETLEPNLAVRDTSVVSWNGSGDTNHGSIVLPSLVNNAEGSYAPTIQIYRFEINGTSLTVKQKSSGDESFSTKVTGTLPAAIPLDNYFSLELLGQGYDGRNIQGMVYFDETFIQDLTTEEILWQPKIVVE